MQECFIEAGKFEVKPSQCRGHMDGIVTVSELSIAGQRIFELLDGALELCICGSSVSEDRLRFSDGFGKGMLLGKFQGAVCVGNRLLRVLRLQLTRTRNEQLDTSGIIGCTLEQRRKSRIGRNITVRRQRLHERYSASGLQLRWHILAAMNAPSEQCKDSVRGYAEAKGFFFYADGVTNSCSASCLLRCCCRLPIWSTTVPS